MSAERSRRGLGKRGRKNTVVQSRAPQPARRSSVERALPETSDTLTDGAVFEGPSADGTLRARLVVEHSFVSAQFFLAGQEGAADLAATLPQPLEDWRGAFRAALPVEVEGLRNGDPWTVTGGVELNSAPPQIALTLKLDKGLDGLRPVTQVTLSPQNLKGPATVKKPGGNGGLLPPAAAVREIEVWFHVEEGLAETRGALDDALDGLERARFEPTEKPGSRIPRQVDGWPVDTWGLTQLHALMVDLAGERIKHPAWRLEMLVLGRSRRPGLRGVMFDSGRVLPRQGAAVFAHAFDAVKPPEERRKRLAGTLLHEMGHALNLVHTFERAVGRPDSASVMNYDWRHAQARPGGTVDDYWRAFDGTFDEDPELRFVNLRRDEYVQPGRAPFHSVDYWTDGPRSVVPSSPRSVAGLELTLHPPRAGRVFEFGRPIFLAVRLKNETGRELRVPQWLLDPKAGLLEVQVRRWSDAKGGGFGSPRSFLPIAQRCFSLDETLASVPDGHVHDDNLNLAFGADGFLFNEPGAYAVTAVLTVPPQYSGGPALTLGTPPLRIRVAYPKTTADERLAADLLDDEVGLFFALGGTAALARARARLEALVEQRQPRGGPVRDALVAALTRCAAIDATRDYVRVEGDRWLRKQPDVEAAVRQFALLDEAALRYFDDSTAGETRELAHQQLAARDPQSPPPAGNAVPPPGAAAGTGVTGGVTAVATPRKWSVYVFMAAESANLDDPLRRDLEELRQRTTAPDAPKVFVQVDTRRADGQRRYAVAKGKLNDLSGGPRGETNGGDPTVLRDFLALRQRFSPHDRTFVVLWGHSQGVGSGFEPPALTLDGGGAADFGFDETSGDALKTWELAQALTLAARGTPFDLVGFDSCFMGSVEIAAELSRAARYLLAPQTASPLTGWHYDRVLDALIAQPDLEPEELGVRVLDQVSVGSDSPLALSLLDLSQAGDLDSPFRGLVSALRAAARNRAEWSRLLAAFEGAAWSGARQFLDVADLCRRLANGTRDPKLRVAARALAATLRPESGRAASLLPGSGRFVVDQRCATTDVLSGVSVYCPWPRVNAAEVLARARNAEVDEDDYRALLFSVKTGWADFVLDPDLTRAVRRAQRVRDFSRRFPSGAVQPAASPGVVSAWLALFQGARAGEETKSPSRGQATEEPPTKSPPRG